jgi:hypothetical protein
LGFGVHLNDGGNQQSVVSCPLLVVGRQ